ncbi:MAG: hypothetical protein MJ146_04220 [Clostridia bacterium]|nr:hypothetical protein [Clostridia bacterium]
MSTFFIKGKKKEGQTLDQQVFGKFKIESRGEVEDYMSWQDRWMMDERLKMPDMDEEALLKKYPLLGQEYEVLTGTITDVMMKQIDEDGYIGHVYMDPDKKKVKQVQIYAHKDFLK